MSTLAQRIHQRQPFPSTTAELYLTLRHVADRLHADMAAVLKEHGGISDVQYNVLRILRGAGEAGATCGEVGERLVTRCPDVTRLIDRLVKAGLVERRRDEVDRRVVRIVLAPEGRSVVDHLDGPVTAHHAHCLAGFDESAQRSVIDHLN
ncbi:MAG: MarR family winged helix-turn-helix transcriptional regulator, partial [Planctomycetota bacterium]